MNMKIKTKRILLMLIGNILCGISVGMFQIASFGIDPYNLGVMGLWHMLKLLDYGTFFWMFGLILLAIDFLFLDKKKLGLGTLASMFLVGYVIEFTHWIWSEILPAPSMWIRILFLIVALVILCFGSSLYYVANLGVSPYDAIPLTIAERTGWKFKIIRVTADCLWVVIGLIGSQLPGVATILIALCLGPLIDAFRPLCRRILGEKENG